MTQYTCLGLTIFKLLLNRTTPTYAGSLFEVLYITIQLNSVYLCVSIVFCFSFSCIAVSFLLQLDLHVITRFHPILCCLHTLQPSKSTLDTNMKIETGRNLYFPPNKELCDVAQW